jgi:PEP-CTERM motif
MDHRCVEGSTTCRRYFLKNSFSTITHRLATGRDSESLWEWTALTRLAIYLICISMARDLWIMIIILADSCCSLITTPAWRTPRLRGSFNRTCSVSVSSVPEPSTWAMMILGFASLGFAGYRSANKTRAAMTAGSTGSTQTLPQELPPNKKPMLSHSAFLAQPIDFIGDPGWSNITYNFQ